MGNPYSEIPHFSFILFLNKFNISLCSYQSILCIVCLRSFELPLAFPLPCHKPCLIPLVSYYST